MQCYMNSSSVGSDIRVNPVKSTRGADWGAELLPEALQVAQEADGYSSLEFQLDSNVSLSTPTAPQSVNVHRSDEMMIRGPAQSNISLPPSYSLTRSMFPAQSGIKSALAVMGYSKWTASRRLIQQEQSSEPPRLFALWNDYYKAEKEAVAQQSGEAVGEVHEEADARDDYYKAEKEAVAQQSGEAVGEIHEEAGPSRQSQFAPSRIKRPPRQRTQSRRTRITQSYLKFVAPVNGYTSTLIGFIQ
ncbi:unnamed protein product [Rodentolepis nana]|uniref:Uncharacterized protein n=1 Tax=Rodentolepis nana TaxID=102285 RepID=A0A0R3TH05_RODNA|nr:unnamed protein product [Rodentolepis nana]